ncbi:MAG: tetratricopeptide repeat protein [Actinobacteria bacterium]|nr:tetratricopeptide repeat protein [Actinomycetota bacterium]
MEERILTRKEKAPFTREGFPERLSPSRRRRDPVLFVPGFLRFSFLSSAFRRRLKDLDYEVYTIRLPNFAAGDIRKGARILMDKMEEMRVLLGVRRLTLVGQGLGGLVARFAVEQMGASEYISRLIMLGTPNRGSYSLYPFFIFKAAREMLPASAFLVNLLSAYDRMLEEEADLPYVSLYTSKDLAIVPWTSCRLEGAENVRVGWFCTHTGLFRSRNLVGVLQGWLEPEDGDPENHIKEGEDALLEELSLSLEKDPQDEGDLFRRGKLLLDGGYYSWAVRDLSRLIKLRPDFPEAYMLRGKALRRKMGYDENPIYSRAVRDFNQVIRLKPGWADAYYERGVCYALLNAWPDAVDSWDRALIINRDLYPAYLARGLGRRKRGDIAGAVEDFTEVLRIQPDEPEALRYLSDMGR